VKARSAAQVTLDRLIAEERQLTAEIEQREARRKTVRVTLERVRLVLNGQQALPITGCEPEVPAPRPAMLPKLSPLQRTVLLATCDATPATGLYSPSSAETRRSASSLEKAGLVVWVSPAVVGPTQAGRDLYDEMKRREAAKS
jgi:hypothetical protein